MSRSIMVWSLLLTGWSLASSPLVGAEPPAGKVAARASSLRVYTQRVAPFLHDHCLACHGEESPEGELNLRALDPDMDSNSATRWAIVRSKLAGGQMPPEDEPRPDNKQIRAVVAWIDAELKRVGKHVAQRAEYDNGNRVPHALLFGRPAEASGGAAPRIRRLSPSIYQRTVLDGAAKGARGVVQPFSVPGGTTFKDMGAPRIDEPTTATLIRNALAIVDKQTAHKIENGVIKKVGSTPKEFLRLLDPKRLPSDQDIAAAVTRQFQTVLQRQPTEPELKRFTDLYRRIAKDASPQAATKYTLAAVFLLPDAVFRWELGSGDPDAGGRVRLAPREIAFAIAYALTDRAPDSRLLRDAQQGKLDTREGVAAVARRMLADPKLAKPPILRFFREYFDYAKAVDVFKDKKQGNFHRAKVLVADTDRLIESILEQDKNVLRELLTTSKSYVEYRAAAQKKKQREEALDKFLAKKAENPEKYKNKKPPTPHASTYLSYNQDGFSAEQPVAMAPDKRAGILTQPAWLVAHAKSDENDVIRRGKWIRERLLGGVVPDLPITVDAQLPHAPEQTLRQRMQVTRDKYCWQCHTLMNRLGLPFEIYDHFGRFRDTEAVVDLEATKANVDKKGRHLGTVMRDISVDATGGVEQVPVDQLQGDVQDAVELLYRLAESEYVEQVFVRHVFRFWMGRNEVASDAASLQAAHAAYRESGGSMKELLVALLTSDAFLYRTQLGDVSTEESHNVNDAPDATPTPAHPAKQLK